MNETCILNKVILLPKGGKLVLEDKKISPSFCENTDVLTVHNPRYRISVVLEFHEGR